MVGRAHMQWDAMVNANGTKRLLLRLVVLSCLASLSRLSKE
jgi:hypothetical protein